MRKSLLLALFFVCLPPAAKAQTTLIPAGTLLHCTIDDPTISPKTAQVGDPVLCHLNQFTELGRADSRAAPTSPDIWKQPSSRAILLAKDISTSFSITLAYRTQIAT